MSLRRLMSQPVTIRRYGTTTNRYNDAERTLLSTAAAKAWITQQSSTDLNGERTGTSSQWVAYLPAGTTLDAGDQIEHDGDIFEVDGRPLRARTPRGEHHIEVRLIEVQG